MGSDIKVRNLTVITAIGRSEPLAWQKELWDSIMGLAAIRKSTLLRWIRIPDGHGIEIYTSLSQDEPSNIEVMTLAENSVGKIGIGKTRNRALEHIIDGWVCTVDSDDYIMANNTAALLFEAEKTHVLWGAGLANDIDGAGNHLFTGPNYFPPGLLAAGAFLRHALENDMPPWRCSATIIDSSVLLAAGGWAIEPQYIRCEDTAMVARITNFISGLWFPRVIQIYRKHINQTTAAPSFLAYPRNLSVLRDYAENTAWQKALATQHGHFQNNIP